MAPIRWTTFTIDLKDTTRRNFSELLLPESRILSQVRSLSIRELDPDDIQSEDDEDPGESSLKMSTNEVYGIHQTRLRQLIDALPENRLREFSASEKIPMTTMECLLERHKTLETLHLTDISNLSLSEHQDRMAGSLSSVKAFDLDLPANIEAANTSLQKCRTLIQDMPRLAYLIISRHDKTYLGNSSRADLSNLLMGGDNTSNTLSLTGLYLARVSLYLSSALLLQKVDFTRIRMLNLMRCDGMGTLLDELAIFYSSHSNAALYSFDLELNHYHLTRRITQSVEEFLQVCPALRRLSINVCQSDLIPTAPIMTKHAKTLRSLVLITGHFPFLDGGRSYTVEDIRSIIGACVNLRRLAIDLPTVDMGPVEALGADFRLGDNDAGITGPKTKLEAFLVSKSRLVTIHLLIVHQEAIAAHPHLYLLRITHVPVIKYSGNHHLRSPFQCEPVNDEEIDMTRVILQHFANQVMQFLHARGSKIRIFHLEPLLRPVTRQKKDTNGHQWPTYTYLRRKGKDFHGMEKAVACPLVNAAKEMPEEAVFL
jgi:hypothetical protein